MRTALPPEDRAMLDELHAKHCSPASEEQRSHHELAPGSWMPICLSASFQAEPDVRPTTEPGSKVRSRGTLDAWAEVADRKVRKSDPLPRELDGRRLTRRELDEVAA